MDTVSDLELRRRTIEIAKAAFGRSGWGTTGDDHDPDGLDDVDPAVRNAVDAVVREELARLPRLAGELIEGRLAMDRWPLRV